MRLSKLITFIVCMIIPVMVGGIAGIVTTESNGWYTRLSKPFFNPPDFIFGPIWTVLYLLMGISLYLIWQAPKNRRRKRALYVFSIQLILNFAWSFIFFYYHQILLALLGIALLWISIVVMIMVFYRINKAAADLQVPYLIWVSFAAVLNAAIWLLN
jgi:benzodiazapine receptor